MQKILFMMMICLSSQHLLADQVKVNSATNKSVAVATPTPTPTPTSIEPTIASQRAFDRAMLQIRAGDMEGAQKELSLSIEKSPNYASAYANRGLVNQHLGNKTRALDDINKAIAIEPSNALWIYNLAAYYSLNNQVDIGLDTLEKSLSLGFAKSDNTQINALKFGDVGDSDLINLKKRKKEYCNLLERHGKFLCN